MLHSALGQRQNLVRYRQITSPPEELFPSGIQYHIVALPRAVSTSSMGFNSLAGIRCIPIRVFNSQVENAGCVLLDIDILQPIKGKIKPYSLSTLSILHPVKYLQSHLSFFDDPSLFPSIVPYLNFQQHTCCPN